MNTLTVRRLLVDLDTPLPRRWCGGDAFRSAFFNALSMSFPAGEQLFIDSVKKGLAELPPGQREHFAAEVQGFIGQEATHRRIHQRFNAHLLNQGLKNRYEERILSRRPMLESINARVRKTIKTRGHFPTDDAATKLIWLALRNITREWVRPALHWKMAMSQFAILYDDRFTGPRA